MHPLIEQIEALFLPDMERLTSDMQKRFPELKFSLWRGPIGLKTEYQGYEIAVECICPRVGGLAADNVALSVDLCHLNSTPRVMADVVWGHPSGHVEKAFRDDWNVNAEWPEATPEGIRKLVETYPDIVRAFELAVQRGAASNG